MEKLRISYVIINGPYTDMFEKVLLKCHKNSE